MSIAGVNLNSPLTYLPPTKPAVKSNATANTTPTTPTTPTSDSGGLTGTTTGTTFLNLLVKELQNQDPSAPMDSTAMVGQMISLNQLDQLVSINQNLTPAASTSTTPTKPVTHAVGATDAASTPTSAAVMNARTALQNSISSAGSLNAASLAAGNPNTTLDLSGFNNQLGGK